MNAIEPDSVAAREPAGIPRRNIMLTIAYDGTNYQGWQVQPNGPTIQQCVEDAVAKLTGERRRLYCAGRTDTGVHALGQVANFQTQCRIPVRSFRRGLQTHLPPDIVIAGVREVAADFHATFSAIRKRYRYVLHDADVCPPFLRNYVQKSQVRLDAARMQEAARCLLGTHDFRCFETKYPNKMTSVRTIQEATIRRTRVWHPWDMCSVSEPDARPHEEPDAPFLLFEVMADGFLYNMVRAIVGTLTEIGRGKQPPEFLAEVIRSMDRSCAGMTAVPQGLYLVKVDYPDQLLRPDCGLQ